jgi:outer membrane translocation and assembly module TamA
MLYRLAWPIAMGMVGVVCATVSSAQVFFPHSGQCPQMIASQDKQQLSVETTIAELTFNDDVQMPVAEQAKIAAALKSRMYEGSPDGVANETAERVRQAWQEHGYFKADVTGYDSTVLTSNPVAARIALHVRVYEGQQYRLGGISFKNNQVITKIQELRSLFPLKDGGIFDTDMVRRGLDNLRKAYGELGYINFTSVPDTEIDEQTRTVSLVIDMDEGKPFYIGSVNLFGLQDWDVSAALKEFSLVQGRVYNTRLAQDFFNKYASGLPPGSADRHISDQINEQLGTVALTFDFRPCPN